MTESVIIQPITFGADGWRKTTVTRRSNGIDQDWPRWERRDGKWRVEETSYNVARPFYVMHSNQGTHWSVTHHFRVRFATPEAAMAGINKRFPLEP